jgi:hypothetical protein
VEGAACGEVVGRACGDVGGTGTGAFVGTTGFDVGDTMGGKTGGLEAA